MRTCLVAEVGLNLSLEVGMKLLSERDENRNEATL